MYENFNIVVFNFYFILILVRDNQKSMKYDSTYSELMYQNNFFDILHLIQLFCMYF